MPSQLPHHHRRPSAWRADQLRSGDIVLLRTDWTDRMYGTWPGYFTQSAFFPWESAEWLVAKGPKSIGFDIFEQYGACLPVSASEDFPCIG
jgi:arylformamidase